MTDPETADNRWTDREQPLFSILPRRAAGGHGRRGFVGPNRPTLPALISLNIQSARPKVHAGGKVETAAERK